MQRVYCTEATVPVTGEFLAGRPVRTTAGTVISLGKADHGGLAIP